MGDLSNHIYLASRSLRRRELLKQIGISFEVLLTRDNPSRGVDVNEDPLPSKLLGAYVVGVARAKAEEGWQQMVKRKLRAYPLIAADTSVALGNEIIGKPCDRDHATAILQRLSGMQHQVCSAVAVFNADTFESRLSISILQKLSTTLQLARDWTKQGPMRYKAKMLFLFVICKEVTLASWDFLDMGVAGS